jgi:hypothetical protein
MPEAREWTGSVAVLPEAMAELAVEMMNLATQQADPAVVRQWLRNHASTLGEWSSAVRELYVRVDETDGEVPTNAQGIALARFLRAQFRDDVHPGDRSAHVSRGGAGLGDDYLHVVLNPYGRRFEGGIDREGRVST